MMESELRRLYPELEEAIFKDHRNVVISGPGGTGKSYSIGMIKNQAAKMGRQCDVTSTTGVSAHAIGGSTIHRFSSIQLGDKPVSVLVDKIRKNKDKLNRWKNADIIIIDECSMLGANILTLLDAIGKEIRLGKRELRLRQKKKVPIPPFGGVQIIISADFCQLPPINDEYAFKSPVWDALDPFYFRMTHPYRYPDLDHFHRIMRIRVGEHTEEDIAVLRTRVTAYDEYRRRERLGEMKEAIKPTRIYPLKKDVEAINMGELDKLDEDSIVYDADDIITIKLKGDGSPMVNPESVNSSEYIEYMDGIAPAELIMKVGAQVMLTKNLDVDMGLVNGSRGVVQECCDERISVLFKNGMEIDIVPAAYEYEDDNVIAYRHQFPLILAYASSVHKQQGATLDYAIIDLGTSLFGPAMGYVALSRCKCMDGIFIVNLMPEKLRVDPEALEFENKIIKLSAKARLIDCEEKSDIEIPVPPE